MRGTGHRRRRGCRSRLWSQSESQCGRFDRLRFRRRAGTPHRRRPRRGQRRRQRRTRTAWNSRFSRAFRVDAFKKRLGLLMRCKQPRGDLEHLRIAMRSRLKIRQTMLLRERKRLIKKRADPLLLLRIHRPVISRPAAFPPAGSRPRRNPCSARHWRRRCFSNPLRHHP